MKSVIAIIISYQPDFYTLSKLIDTITTQVSRIVLVDNSSDVNVTEFLTDIPCTKLHCIFLKSNLGIAAAQNTGINWAKKQNASDIILFDQDSNPAQNLVEKLIISTKILTAHGVTVSATGPHLDIHRKIQPSKFLNNHQLNNITYHIVPVTALISSGSLISIRLFDDVGLMDESLFIDRVDTEWFLRANAKGYQAFGVPDAIMHHPLGEKTWKVWFGRWRYVPQHKPFRHYYMFRNSLLLYKRSYIPFRWKAYDLVNLIYLLVFCMTCMPERWKRLKMIVLGIYDGLRGASGKLECTCE